jgi:hypothetical protein
MRTQLNAFRQIREKLVVVAHLHTRHIGFGGHAAGQMKAVQECAVAGNVAAAAAAAACRAISVHAAHVMSSSTGLSVVNTMLLVIASARCSASQ